ncbi:hypothetical protein [Salinifilum ghardaiensis]
MGDPSGPQLSSTLLCGDYLQVSAPRSAVSGHGADAGFARIEHIEHLPEEQVDTVLDRHLPLKAPAPIVWCHGLPGPVVLRGGDVQVLDVVSPRRVAHDTHHPWWPPAGETPLLRGARPAGDTPGVFRREHNRTADAFTWPEPSTRDRVDRRPTSFPKPASALLVGDYLGVHPHRWPETDRDVDEGFSRIEHLRLLPAEQAAAVFAEASWHTDIVVVSVSGISGVLLLRESEEVAVLAFVNPERAAWERRELAAPVPLLQVRGSHEPTEEDLRSAEQVDAARRPDVDETELYPSRFPDAFTRRMALESVEGFRSVPLAALPWPHGQSDCPLEDLAEQYQDRVPDVHGAHATACLSRQGQQIRTTCAYHQADWPRLVRMLEESLAENTGESLRRRVKTHREFEHLSPSEQKWLDSLVYDPISWDDGSDALGNGQHRLCALRFAGVTRCPIQGQYLPETEYGPERPVEADARAEITASWRRLAAENGWPVWLASLARFLPPSWRAWVLETHPPRRLRRLN